MLDRTFLTQNNFKNLEFEHFALFLCLGARHCGHGLPSVVLWALFKLNPHLVSFSVGPFTWVTCCALAYK